MGIIMSNHTVVSSKEWFSARNWKYQPNIMNAIPAATCVFAARRLAVGPSA
jgi:hypothetical protein